MTIILPQKIGSIIAGLNNAGFPAHVVGGCVRDLVMRKEPSDWDITTSARPEQVKEIFGKTWDTGLKHGTVTISFEGQIAEITTWRADMAYLDHRHPERVEFTNSLDTDLSRRDFTMNAMAYHPDEGLIDPFNGTADIINRLIRTVGDPDRRFSEDALRMLRAVRFSAQLGFDIDNETYEAIKRLHRDIAYVSAERVRSELDKIMESAHPGLMSLIWDTGMNSVVFPEIISFPGACAKVCGSLAPNPENRITVLSALLYGTFPGCTQEKIRQIMHKLKYDNRSISEVSATIRAIDALAAISPRNMRRAAYLYGRDAAARAVQILHADPENSRTNDSNAIIRMYEPLRNPVTGTDLSEAGLASGKEIGTILSVLNLCLFENPSLEDRETLMAIASEIRRKFPL